MRLPGAFTTLFEPKYNHSALFHMQKLTLMTSFILELNVLPRSPVSGVFAHPA